MGIVAEHKQKQADYERLKELCGGQDVDDYCGAWCNNDVLTDMLRVPTKRKAISYYRSLITRYFDTGFENRKHSNIPERINTCDPEIYEILKRNGDV